MSERVDTRLGQQVATCRRVRCNVQAGYIEHLSVLIVVNIAAVRRSRVSRVEVEYLGLDRLRVQHWPLQRVQTEGTSASEESVRFGMWIPMTNRLGVLGGKGECRRWGHRGSWGGDVRHVGIARVLFAVLVT